MSRPAPRRTREDGHPQPCKHDGACACIARHSQHARRPPGIPRANTRPPVTSRPCVEASARPVLAVRKRTLPSWPATLWIGMAVLRTSQSLRLLPVSSWEPDTSCCSKRKERVGAGGVSLAAQHGAAAVAQEAHSSQGQERCGGRASCAQKYSNDFLTVTAKPRFHGQKSHCSKLFHHCAQHGKHRTGEGF